MEENIDDLVKTKLSAYTEDELNQLGKDYRKKRKRTLTIYLILSILGLVICLSLVTVNVVFGIFAFFIVIFLVISIYDLNDIKKIKSDKELYIRKIKRDILKEQEIKQKEQEEREAAKHIDGKEIKSVVLIDSYTELSDKLHAFLNYQEIIQTRIYKFKVFFVDNTSKVYTTEENSKLYNKLIKFINNNENQNVTTVNLDLTEELRKYKSLLDDNIITEEEFNKKKSELLNNSNNKNDKWSSWE